MELSVRRHLGKESPEHTNVFRLKVCYNKAFFQERARENICVA